ncbi:MAG TPA: hypothetical protein VKW06_09655 [Candidatus Angelobacter sp.]|nr:hypothetical protein [Candidatus Angelobacter sp.]
MNKVTCVTEMRNADKQGGKGGTEIRCDESLSTVFLFCFFLRSWQFLSWSFGPWHFEDRGDRKIRKSLKATAQGSLQVNQHGFEFRAIYL